MNRFKKSLLFCMSFVLALSFLVTAFPKKSNTSSAVDSNNIQVVDENALKYVTISTDGQTLTQSEIKNFDTDLDGKIDSSYVFVNRTATLTFEPLTYAYSAVFESTYFYESVDSDSIKLTRANSEDEFPTRFTYNDVEYSYQIDANNVLTITNTETNQRFSESEFISVSDNETTRTFEIITAYTLKAESPNTSFSFIPSNSSDNALKTNNYIINFEHPVANFKTEDVTLFTCLGLDIGETEFSNTKIEKELSYENIKFQITNNDYTETNPLYFDINYNGFIYTFKLFSKTIREDDYLFVEYYDTQRTDNNLSLATKLDANGNIVVDDTSPVYKYYGATTEFNTFSIDFNKTGRYEIAIYDETYLLSLKDYNYYTTSFYIKSSDSSNSNSAFENAYAIMQNFDDEGNFSDFIVSGSTQNANVQVTVKNLSFYFDNDEVISNLSDEEESSLSAVEFIETTLTGSLNIPVSTYYTVTELREYLKDSQDFKIDCQNDSFYEVIIYQYQKNADNSFSVKNKTSYNFTIVKQPKISFTVFRVDENNDPIPIPGTNKYETDIKEADIPFTTTPIDYKLNINSQMEVLTFFRNPSATKTTVLDKTYLNEYTINYAMQLVKMEQIEIIKEGTDKALNVLAIQFHGVGDIKVKVTVNSITTDYTVQSGENLIFENYGEYSVSIQDSMGTTATAEFSFQKPTSVSAIILIALVCVLILAIVLFVIASRGKVSTR